MATLIRSTGLKSPSTTGTTNNAWGTPSNAYASDNARATSENTSDLQDYGGFGISIPSGSTILGIEVVLEALSASSAGTLDVSLSWNGTTNYTTAKVTSTIPSSDTTITLGSKEDTWGRAWLPSELSDGTFFVKVDNNTGTFDVDIDHLQVRVTYISAQGRTIVVSDTFTVESDTALSSHNPDTGDASSWSEFQDVTGDLECVASTDFLRGTDGFSDGSHYWNSTSVGTANYNVVAKVASFPTIGSDDPMYLFGRVADAGSGHENFYAVELLLGTGVTLYKRAANATPTTGWTSLGNNSTNPVTGDWIELEMTATHVKVHKNGVEILSVADTTYTAEGRGGIGIGSFRNSGDDQATDSLWDNFYIHKETPPIEQEGFRFRDDDDDEAGAAWLEAQDTDISRDKNVNTRLRFILDSTLDPASSQFQLEYKKDDAAEWRNILAANPAISFVGVGSTVGSSNGATPPDVSLPSGIQAGDLMVTVFYSRVDSSGDNNTVSISAGWDQVYNERSSGGLMAVWTRIYQSGDVAPAISIQNHTGGTSGDTVIGTLAAWRGVDPVDPVSVTGTMSTNGSQADIGAIAGITLGALETLLVIGGKSDDWTSVATLSQSGMTFTEVGEPSRTAGADAGIVWDYAVKDDGASVAVTNKTFTVTGGANAVGKGVMFSLRPRNDAFFLAASSNIAASGEATTPQLTAPSGKTNPTDFTAGRIQDDENPADAVDIGSAKYTEMEWCIKATDDSEYDATYQFRVTKAGTPIDTYTVVPEWTVEEGVATASVSPVPVSVTIPSVAATHRSTAAASPLAVAASIVAVTATYVAVLAASVAPLAVSATIPDVTAQGRWTASVAPLEVDVSPAAVTATYVYETTASVSPVGVSVAPASVTASYIQLETAAMDPIGVTVTPAAVTAQNVASAVPPPLDVSVSVPAVTADYDAVLSAAVAPVPVTVTPAAVTADYVSAFSASVSPLSVSVTAVSTTATHHDVASVNAESVSVTIPVVTAQNVAAAAVAPLGVDVTPAAVTATHRSTASVAPLGVSVSPPSVTATFVGQEGWLDGWTYRKRVTVLATKVAADETDFPVYVDLSDLGADFFDNVKSDGGDIRVTEGDGETEIPRELVFINTTSDKGEVHFKGDISGSVDTDFYVYYGNAGASDYGVTETYGRNNVWENYTAVWHLNEAVNTTADGYADSTGNGNDGTGVSMALTEQDGQLAGKSQDFDGSADYIDCNANVGSFTLTSTFTIQAWINPALGSSEDAIYGNTWADPGYLLRVTSSNKLRILLVTSGSVYKGFDSQTLGAGWTMAHGTWDGSSTVNLYRDGALDNDTSIASGTLTSITSSNNTNIGRTGDSGGFNHYDGLIDEVRVSSVVRDADWIWTEYNNQNDSATFFDVGTQEEFSATQHEAEVSPVVVDVTVPAVSATHRSTAAAAPLVVQVSPQATAATYVQEETASVSPISVTVTVPAIAASYVQVETAAVSPAPIAVSLPAVTAVNYAAAAVAPVEVEITPAATTATYESELSASVDPVEITVTIQGVTAINTATASVDPVAATVSIATVTASYVQVETAQIGFGVHDADFYSESNHSSSILMYAGGSTFGLGQSFDTGAFGGYLNTAKFYVATLGSPPGNVYAKLYAITGTHGTDAKPTGSALATATESGWTGSFALRTFTFSGANRIHLDPDTQYIITIEYNDGDVDNRIQPSQDHTSPTHSGNRSSYNGTTWTASTADLIFYVSLDDTGIPVAAISALEVTAANVATASVAPLGVSVSPASTTATYEAELTASVDPLGVSVSIPSVSANNVATASVAPLSVEVAPQGVTASYEAELTAVVAPVAVSVTIPSVTAVNYAAASVSPLSVSVTPAEVTSTYEAVLEASVAPLVSLVSIPAVTAEHDQSNVASVTPVPVSVTPAAVTATLHDTAQAAPLAVSVTIPSVSATHQSIAALAPVAINVTLPGVSADYAEVHEANVSPVAVSVAPSSVSATHQSTASVAPLSVAVSIASVMGVGSQVEEAEASPVSVTVSLPAVTATHKETADVSPVSVSVTIPSVSVSWIEAVFANVSPVEIELSIPSVTAERVFPGGDGVSKTVFANDVTSRTVTVSDRESGTELPVDVLLDVTVYAKDVLSDETISANDVLASRTVEV